MQELENMPFGGQLVISFFALGFWGAGLGQVQVKGADTDVCEALLQF
jgi:hypothetical protein